MPSRRAVTGLSQEPRQRYAEEVRLLRAERGVSLRQLGTELGWDPSTLGKVENGQSVGSPELAQALDTYYGTGKMLLALWELAIADTQQYKERYRDYMSLESGSVSMWHYGVGTVHGLLQTPAYARELLAAGGLEGEELDQQVELRTQRAELLNGEDVPTFRTILSETVLRTPLKNPAEWREQLEHLLTMSERLKVIIQVLPQSVGLHALTNTDTMFLRAADGSTVAWVETGYSGELVQEAPAVERLQLRYDRVRDLALSPDESREFIRRILEEVPCEPPN
ncbi:helix-turn-helix domain protein [Actinobacteria bacterium OK074]|nr:helix-turn-helix domain protein [Actinobacteria bacterium OK074]